MKPKVHLQAEMHQRVLKPHEIVRFIKSYINQGLPVAVSSYLPSEGNWWGNSDQDPLQIPSDKAVAQWRRLVCKKTGDKSSGKTECDSHAFVITGYDDRTQSFEFKNSWGSTWKDGGYAKMSYAYLERFYTGNAFVALKSAAPYSEFALHTETALHETGDNTTFCLAPNRDLFCILKNGTGTKSTEVHVFSAASQYQAFSLQTGTALHETRDSFEFCLAPNSEHFHLSLIPNRDLYVISKNKTGTNSTEIHVLTEASNYQQFSLHTRTELHETGANTTFCLAPNRDLFCISKSGTGTHSTEVHVLKNR